MSADWNHRDHVTGPTGTTGQCHWSYWDHRTVSLVLLGPQDRVTGPTGTTGTCHWSYWVLLMNADVRGCSRMMSHHVYEAVLSPAGRAASLTFDLLQVPPPTPNLGDSGLCALQRLPAHPSVCLHLSGHVCLPVCLSAAFWVSLPVCLSHGMSACLSV